MVRKRSGPKTSTSWPAPRSRRTMVSMVRTTPLICGRQASETMAMRNRSLRRDSGRRERQPRQPGRMLLGPVQDAQPTVEALDQRGAAFDPVAVVAVKHAVDGANLGMVDMAADHAVDAAAPRLAGDRMLVVVDILDRVLHLVLQIGRE